MSSSETDEESEAYFDERLDQLFCPFNFDMGIRPRIEDESIVLAVTSEQYNKVVDRQEYFPEQVSLWHLLMAYEHTMRDELPMALEHINKAEQSLADVKQKLALENAIRAVEHLVISTKCHVLDELEQTSEMVELLETICTVEEMNETELAMLHGCKCSILTMANTVDVSDMITSAETAIKYEPDNGKWHFLLGKNYRKARRTADWTLETLPDDKETSAFEEAYRLFPNVLFGVTLAQLYRESHNITKADEIYKEVHALQPTSCLVRFQLAIGFIRARECVLAKECLDYIAEKEPKSIRYSHYMAIYEEKCNKDFKAALPHYKHTTENFNSSAEWGYVKCWKKVEPDWDPLPYLLTLSKKYHQRNDYIHQQIYINIGLYYLFQMKDLLRACQYLTDGIKLTVKIDPEMRPLKDHPLLFSEPFKKVNVYHVLAKEVQLALQIGATMYDDEGMAILKNTLELCGKYCKDIPSLSTSSRSRSQSSQWSNGNRNYDRSASSHVQSNWREKTPSSSPGAFSQNYPSRRGNDERNSPEKHSDPSNKRDYTSWRS